MTKITSNRLLRMTEHSGAFVTIMYVKVSIRIKNQRNKIVNTDNLSSYTKFPVN